MFQYITVLHSIVKLYLWIVLSCHCWRDWKMRGDIAILSGCKLLWQSNGLETIGGGRVGAHQEEGGKRAREEGGKGSREEGGKGGPGRKEERARRREEKGPRRRVKMHRSSHLRRYPAASGPATNHTEGTSDSGLYHTNLNDITGFNSLWPSYQPRVVSKALTTMVCVW